MGGVFDEGGIVASHHETGLQAIGHLLDVATERSGDLGIGGFGDGDVAFLLRVTVRLMTAWLLKS